MKMKLTLSRKMYGLVGVMSAIMIIGTVGAVLSLRWLLGSYETLVRVEGSTVTSSRSRGSCTLTAKARSSITRPAVPRA